MTGIIGALCGFSATAVPVSTVSLSNRSPEDTKLDPFDATATLSLSSTGAVLENGVNAGTWLTSGSASAYEVRATPTIGTLTAGLTGAWYSLGTTRTWTVSQTSVGSKSCTMTVEIRAIAAPSTTLATATIELIATVEP